MSDTEFYRSGYFYHSPILYTGLFYLILVIWIEICLMLMGSIEFSLGWPLARLVMIGFVMVYTWYFFAGDLV